MWNPFYILYECLGPKVCARLAILVCIAATIAVAIFGGPFFSSILSVGDYVTRFLRLMPSPLDWFLPLLFVFSIVGCVVCICHKFRRVCRPIARCCGKCFCFCCPCCKEKEVEYYMEATEYEMLPTEDPDALDAPPRGGEAAAGDVGGGGGGASSDAGAPSGSGGAEDGAGGAVESKKDV